MKFSELGPQAISRADVWSFNIAMWVTNQNLCVSPTEVGIFVEIVHCKPHPTNADANTGVARAAVAVAEWGAGVGRAEWW